MRTIVFDFDGVIHKYSKGWQDGSIYDGPNEGISAIINELRMHYGYQVVIVSTRCATEEGLEAVQEWCKNNGIIVDRICKEKPPALVYIDDRALKYDPEDNNLLNEIMTFKPDIQKAQEYDKLNELELIGLLNLRNAEFKRVNDEFDRTRKSNDTKKSMILSLKMMDEWIASVRKYTPDDEILSTETKIDSTPNEYYHVEYKENLKNYIDD